MTGEHPRRSPRYIIIGAGMAGILAAIKLKQRGEAFVLFEKAARLGGTWRDNRYPGLTCDVPAHAYTYSFAPYAEWQSYYAGGEEIRTYFEVVAETFGIGPYIRFGEEVVACAWDEEQLSWRVTLASGEACDAEVVIAASGVLHHPRRPEIDGMSDFAGAAFHSARWDDAAAIDGARVGVIGNGSTGVQLVSALHDRADRLVHFQRSPQWIMPVPQFPYSDVEREAFRRDPALIDAIRFDPDYWSAIHRFTRAITDIDGPEIAAIEKLCLDNLENSVRDPALREKLRPGYRAACKRLIYSWSYYDAVQSPRVSVERVPIDRIESRGVRLAGGQLVPLDTLVFATGFHADRFIRPASVTGRGGRTLDGQWQVRPSAYYAISIPGFPNFFMLNGPTGPVGNFSLIDIAERQWGYIEALLDAMRQAGAKAVEPTASAFEDYEARRIAAARTTIFGSGCTSWYLDASGVPSSWPWSYEAFADAMARPKLEDFILHDQPEETNR